MAYTLVEANKYTQNVLQAGVVELFVRDDPVLERLPFVTIMGSGLTYLRESVEAGVDFYAVGDTWAEGTHQVTEHTAVLRILGGDCDVDNFLKQTRSDVNDLKAEAIAAKVKAMKKEFMETFLYGYNTGAPKEFDGMHYLINSATYNTVPIGTNATTPAALSLLKVEEAIDMVKGFTPALIVGSKQLRRYINKYLRGVGGITYMDAGNKRVQSLFDIPFAASDYVLDTENCDQLIGSTYYGYEPTTPAATSDGSTSLFIFAFDPKGACGCQSGSMTIEEVGSGKNLETKDATRHRIKWYCSCMLQSLISCSKVTGIDVDGTVTA